MRVTVQAGSDGVELFRAAWVPPAAAGYPAWVTPQVTHAGFVTGVALAALKPDDVPNQTVLDGPLLDTMLDSGLYHVQYPEHGALLVVAALRRAGDHAAADALLGQLRPYFDALRLYPEAANVPVRPTPTVSVSTVQDARAALRATIADIENPAKRQVKCQASALTGWVPFRHKLLALFARTVVCGHMPEYERTSAPTVIGGFFHKGRVRPGRKYVPGCGHRSCGWPLQQLDCPGWTADAAALLQEYEELCRTTLNVYRNGSSMHTLATCLRECVGGSSKTMLPRMVGLLRDVLAGWQSTRGVPGSSPVFDQYVAGINKCRNAVVTRTKTVVQACRVLLTRLDAFDNSRGIEHPDSVLVDFTDDDDVTRLAVPKSLHHIVERTVETTAGDLVTRGLVTSAEMLAAIVQPLTASATCNAITDVALQRLQYALRVAFCHRRSLLLLNLKHQTTFTDLPWVPPLLALCAGDTNVEAHAARNVLVELLSVMFTAFPHTIVPNKLLQSIRTLCTTAKIENVPLVDEIAADIFMHAFTPKFLVAARIAAVTAGDLYCKYYNIGDEYARLLDARFQASEFAALCASTVTGGMRYSVVHNAMIIERQQILTTQNLAVLLPLLPQPVDYAAMATKSWNWICAHVDDVFMYAYLMSTLTLRKDVAYAWRQCVYYLSHVEEPHAVVDGWANDKHGILDGLKQVMETGTASPKPFLGWVVRS
jgi:hypothetical protein